MRIISISTENYLPNAQRLFQSIRRFYPNAQLTLFSESNDPKNLLNGLDVNIILLPEIRSLGVKRAKFKAYSLASCDGGFVYLDSDIIVLQKLKELENVSYFTACKDDLSECPFIINKLYPWENYPTIQASNYFNSGVFACPVGMQNFFKTIEAESCNDSDWESVVIPGKLYDNHFLCFKIVHMKSKRYSTERENFIHYATYLSISIMNLLKVFILIDSNNNYQKTRHLIC
jgi:hypothetical protein